MATAPNEGLSGVCPIASDDPLNSAATQTTLPAITAVLPRTNAENPYLRSEAQFRRLPSWWFIFDPSPKLCLDTPVFPMPNYDNVIIRSGLRVKVDDFCNLSQIWRTRQDID